MAKRSLHLVATEIVKSDPDFEKRLSELVDRNPKILDEWRSIGVARRRVELDLIRIPTYLSFLSTRSKSNILRDVDIAMLSECLSISAAEVRSDLRDLRKIKKYKTRL